MQTHSHEHEQQPAATGRRSRSEGTLSENSIENKDAVEGETIKLACRYDPSVRSEGRELAFYWQKTNSRGVQDVVAINANSLSTDYVLESNDGKYDLMIVTAQYERDNGQFECKIKEAGSGLSVQSKAYVVTILCEYKHSMPLCIIAGLHSQTSGVNMISI